MQAGEIPGNKASSGVPFTDYYAAVINVPNPKHLRVCHCTFYQALISTTTYCMQLLVCGGNGLEVKLVSFPHLLSWPSWSLISS